MTRILITSALPYINGVKHLGNLVGSMLPADVYARFERARGADVLYICATDEHGTPAELAALEAGQEVAAYCREQHGIQAELGKQFALSWDYFGRSSSPQNAELTQHFARRLEENGLIEERLDTQVYSVDDGRFLPDRYIIGTCPHCGYDRARGDQCENCTRVLDPTDLIDARSAISGSTNLEVRETRHLYLLQSTMVDKLRAWIGENGDWPHLVTSIALKWLDEGLHDRCITRDLQWGVPVDRAGFEDKVFYVWFDAPIEYIGATKEWADAAPGEERDWEGWWRTDKGVNDVRYIEFMAKDNVPFHTVGFPVTIMGSQEPWKLVDYIKGLNWLTFYGGKFSTSQKRGVFMDHALELLPADYWRYYLIANAPEGSDASFTWEHFQSVVNKDLADVLGNFVNRTLRFTNSRFGSEVPEGGAWGPLEDRLIEDLSARVAQFTAHLESFEFRKAAGELRAIWALGNEYLTEAAPWTVVKEDKAAAAVSVRTAINLIRLFAEISAPLIPSAANAMLDAIGEDPADLRWPDGNDIAGVLQRVPAGRTFTIPDVLFRKIADEDVAQWSERFGGAELLEGGAPPEEPVPVRDRPLA